MDLYSVLSPHLLILLFFAAVVACLYYFRHRNVPPGPKGLPFLGYSPFFGTHPQDKFIELGKKYGNVLSLYMGPQLTIVLNDYEAIRAAFIGQADIFTGRAASFVFRHVSTGDDGQIHGITLAEGDVWKTTRRFMLQTFRNLGMGKSTIQDRILEEAEFLSDVLAQHNGQAFNPFHTLLSSFANVVCILCFGRRFEHSDANFISVLRDVENTTSNLAQAGPLQSYPILRFLPGSMSTSWKSFTSTFQRNTQFTRDMIQEHKRTYVETETRDYIDAFLHQQKKDALVDKDPQPAFLDDDLLKNLRGLFGAGMETTTVTMYWILLFMINHPDVQAKVQEELDENIGPMRSVTVEDRVNVPYVEAVIREVQRLANVSPFGLLRANREETTLLTYRIPKRCFVMPNFKALTELWIIADKTNFGIDAENYETCPVNVDPNLWADPLAFKPERFIDAQGKLFEPPHFMPFSFGKRACVGESLARMELFLFFSNIFKRFEIKPSNSGFPPTNQYTTGISCRPLPFEIRAVARR